MMEEEPRTRIPTLRLRLTQASQKADRTGLLSMRFG